MLKRTVFRRAFVLLVGILALSVIGNVIIDEPTGNLYYGGDVAAPLFGNVMAESLRLLAVPPDATLVGAQEGLFQVMSQ